MASQGDGTQMYVDTPQQDCNRCDDDNDDVHGIDINNNNNNNNGNNNNTQRAGNAAPSWLPYLPKLPAASARPLSLTFRVTPVSAHSRGRRSSYGTSNRGNSQG